MARGDMGVVTQKVGTQVEILNRLPFEGVPMTIDFSSVSDTDADTGEGCKIPCHCRHAHGRVS